MDWLVKNLSTLGPVGTKLPAPGTFGSLVGVIIFIFLIWLLTIPPFFILLFFFLLFNSFRGPFLLFEIAFDVGIVIIFAMVLIVF